MQEGGEAAMAEEKGRDQHRVSTGLSQRHGNTLGPI